MANVTEDKIRQIMQSVQRELEQGLRDGKAEMRERVRPYRVLLHGMYEAAKDAGPVERGTVLRKLIAAWSDFVPADVLDWMKTNRPKHLLGHAAAYQVKPGDSESRARAVAALDFNLNVLPDSCPGPDAANVCVGAVPPSTERDAAWETLPGAGA